MKRFLDESVRDMCERRAQNTHPMHRHLESFQCFDLRSCAIGLYDSRPRPVPESRCGGLASRSSDGRRSAIRHLDRSVSNCCRSGRAGSLKSSCDSSRISSSACNRQTILRVFIFDVFGKFPGRDLQGYGTQEKFHARSVDGISTGLRSHSGLGKLAWRKLRQGTFFSQV